MSCGIGRRCGLDPVLLWLWCRLAATALNGPLACEHPCAADIALEKTKKKKERKKRKNSGYLDYSQCGAIMNNAAVTIDAYIFMQTQVFIFSWVKTQVWYR